MKYGVPLVAPNSFTALTSLAPMTQTVANNLQSSILTDIHFTQELHSHLCLSVSMAKIVREW